MSAIESGDWTDADFLRVLGAYSADRLACFGKKSAVLDPWDKQFLVALKHAHSNQKLTLDLKKQIRAAVYRHCWNAKVGGDLYLIVQAAEVLSRNALSSAIGREFNSPEWLLAVEKKQTPERMRVEGLLSKDDEGKIRRAGKAACGKYESSNQNYKAHHSDILAELEFGFWVRLVEKNRGDKSKERTWEELWERMTKSVVPYAEPDKIKREQLFAWLTNALEVRNAIFHHHPLWASKDLLDLRSKCSAQKTQKDSMVVRFMRERHRLVYELIDAICKPCGEVTRRYDRIDKIFRQAFPF
jgi:hypothetical protein